MWELGRFTPESLGDFITPDEVEEWTSKRLAYRSRDIHVRHPEHEWSMVNDRATGPGSVANWHHDGLTHGDKGYLIVWSNEMQTEVMDDVTGRVFQPEPGVVFAFDNMRFSHRTPSRRSQRGGWSNRWFVRMDAPMMGVVLDVPGVWALEV